MRYKGYVVTYIGETRKVNNDNFFLNGFCKENTEEPFIFDRNKEFRSRNLYALASGAKCKDDGDELAYSVVDILRTFYVADFDAVSRELFHVANTAVTSHVLDRTDGHYELDLSVLSIDRDVATVYNMGDVPVFHYENGILTKMSGKAPKTVDLEKDYLDGNEVKTKAYTVENVPYIGTLDPNMEVVPYTSPRKKIRKKGYFILCSKEVVDVIDEKTMVDVLNNKDIKDKHKALVMLDKAIKKEPEGNYTIEVIVVKRGLAIAEDELKSLGKWLAAAGLCITLCLNGSFIISGISNIADGIKSFVQEFSSDDEETPRDDLKWIPKEEREKAEAEEEEELIEEAIVEPVENHEEQSNESTVENAENQSAEQTTVPASQNVQKSQPKPAAQNTQNIQKNQNSQNAVSSSPQNSEQSSNRESSERPARQNTSPRSSGTVTAPPTVTNQPNSEPSSPAPSVSSSEPAPAPPTPVEQSPTMGSNELPLSQ